MSFDAALPVIFMVLMGVSMLVYVVSDGYDLGVGMLMHRATDAEKDVLVASIGPFWLNGARRTAGGGGAPRPPARSVRACGRSSAGA